MATYFSLNDGLITDTSTYGYSISGIEKTNNTTGYNLLTSDSWSIALSSNTTDVIDSFAVHLSSRVANPTGTLTFQVSSRTVSPTTLGTCPISSFTSYDGSNNLLASYPLNWQLLKLSTPFTNSTGVFKLNLKTSNPNQLSLMALSTVNGIDYDRMCMLSSVPVIGLSGTLTKTGTTLSAASPFGVGTDSSIVFNGTSDFITVPYSSSLDLSNDPYTVELWLNYTAPDYSTGRNIFNKGSSTNLAYQSYIESTTGFIKGIVSSSYQVPRNTWLHIAYVYDGTTTTLYASGNNVGTTTNKPNVNSLAFNIGNLPGQSSYFKGLISNFRIIRGDALYTSNFTVPSATLNLYSTTKLDQYTAFLYKSPYSTNFLYTDYIHNIHICSLADGYSSISRTVTATNFTANNLYIHNKGTLTFPASSTTLTLAGSAGLQITSDGTLNIGTSSKPVPANITHQVVLSSNSIDVHNGGNLNVYGYPKLVSTNLKNDYSSGTRTFTTVDDVSSSWVVDDTLSFKPNLSARTSSSDTLTLSSFNANNVFTTTVNSSYTHTGSATYAVIPAIYNLSRNVSINGGVHVLDAGKANISYANLNNSNSLRDYLRGNLLIANNSNGNTTLSGNSLTNNGVAGNVYFGSERTETAVYLNGSTILTAPWSASLFNLSNTFTVEFWVNHSGVTTAQEKSIFNIVDTFTSFFAFLNFSIYANTGQIYYNCRPGTGVPNSDAISQSGPILDANTWHHVALANNNGSCRFFVDGVQYGVTKSLSGLTCTNTPLVEVGRLNNGYTAGESSYFTGYVSNLRVVNGTCVYTSNFTVPNRPLPVISSTSLLCFQNDYTKDASPNNLTISVNTGSPSLVRDRYIVNYPQYATNSIISNNVFNKVASIGAMNIQNGVFNNATINNNYILSSIGNGLVIGNSTGSLDISNNTIVGSLSSGTYLYNNTLSSVGTMNYNSALQGMLVSGTNTGTIFGGSINSAREGVYVDASTSNLSGVTFQAMSAIGGSTVGFNVAGNPINHLSPITLNINGLVANNNLSGGFEGYAITGNLSSLELNNNNFYGMKTSIGNAPTTIDGITALMNNNATTSAAIGILAGLSYYPITIKNANVGKDTNTNTRGAGISLDSTKFSQFYVENSIVSGGASDFQLKTTNNILEGSYMISNTKVGTLPVGVGVTSSNYQSDVLKTTGFAFTNMNNISGYHVTYLAAGNRSIDSTVYINAASSPSERLTPQSTTLKLRSGSKFVALSANESTTVNVYVRKSTVATNGVAYNGTAPRLILKRNGAMGINSDIVMDQLDTTSENFLKLSGVTPVVSDAGVLEFYVDCDGTTGWINIDNWAAN
jgi:hypothetical protein